jgi:hypothetical protein
MATTLGTFPDPIDPILDSYVNAIDDAAARKAAEVVFARHTIPLLDRIIGFKTWSYGIEAQASRDLRSEVLLSLWIRLRKCREGDDQIRCWSTYVKQTIQNTWRTYLRHKRPKWHALKNRIRYLLRTREEFTLWQDDNGEWLCGLTPAFSGAPVSTERSTAIVNASSMIDVGCGVARQTPQALGEQLRSLLAEAGGPVDLDTVVVALFRLQTSDHSVISIEEPGVAQALTASGPPIDVDIGRREILSQLWREIRTLPLMQRQTLLLNLRAGDDLPVIELLPITGIATVSEIAEALGESVKELIRLWPHLPLDDATIAGKLGKTRQQVINLRKSARDRLKRKLKATP